MKNISSRKKETNKIKKKRKQKKYRKKDTTHRNGFETFKSKNVCLFDDIEEKISKKINKWPI